MADAGHVGALPVVIANANNIMALSVIRSLGRRGVGAWAVFGRSAERPPYGWIVRHSRYVRRVVEFDEAGYDENLVAALLRVGGQLPDRAVLFPVSDKDMIVVSAHRAQLAACYRLLMPPHELLDAILNKDRFCEVALRLGLPVPRTFQPSDPGAVDEIAREVRYPCIIKPPWRDEAWLRLYHNTKVLTCRTAEELRRSCADVLARFGRLTVQEVIPGDERNIVCSFTYLDGESRPYGIFQCRKLRQFPPHFGNTALAEGCAVPEVEALTREICTKLGLVGYASIEFKLDPADGRYKILEITPARINRQAGLADASGLNIPQIWHAHLMGDPVTPPRCEVGRQWVSEVNEIRALGPYLRAGEWTLGRWLRSYRNVRRCEILALDDLAPFLTLGPSVLASILARWRL